MGKEGGREVTDEEMDQDDHILRAVRKASEKGFTKEQFLHAAGVFWDSWHLAKEFMSVKNSPFVIEHQRRHKEAGK